MNGSRTSHRTLTMNGGIRRDVSHFVPEMGLWSCDGFHTNVQSSLVKWPGFRRDDDSFLTYPITGLYQVTLNGKTYKIAMSGGWIRRMDAGFAVNIGTLHRNPVDETLSQTPYDGAVLGNYFYVCNGLNHNKKVSHDLLLSETGITPPSTEMTHALVAGLIPAGTYQYVSTFVRASTNGESNPSPVHQVVVAGSQQVDLSNIPGSSDPDVTKIRLYRTAAGSGVFLFLAEINSTDATYSDNVVDASLVGEELQQFNDVPPLSKYIEVYNGMMFYGGLASPHQSRIHASQLLNPESVDLDDIYDLDPEDEDIVTGIIRYGKQLAVFKRNSLFLGRGNEPSLMDFSKARVSQGTISNWGIIHYLGNLFYPSEHGIYRFDGVQEHYMSKEIEDLYRTFSLNSFSPPSGIFYPELNMLLWSFTTSGGDGSPDTLLCHNVKNGEWTTRPLKAARLSTFNNSLGQTRMWVGRHEGWLWEGGGSMFDVVDKVKAEVIFRSADFYEKLTVDLNHFRNIYIAYTPVPGATDSVEVSYAKDDPTNSYKVLETFLPSSEAGRISIPMDAQCLRVFVKISVTSGEPFNILAVQIDGKALVRYDT